MCLENEKNYHYFFFASNSHSVRRIACQKRKRENQHSHRNVEFTHNTQDNIAITSKPDCLQQPTLSLSHTCTMLKCLIRTMSKQTENTQQCANAKACDNIVALSLARDMNSQEINFNYLCDSLV